MSVLYPPTRHYEGCTLTVTEMLKKYTASREKRVEKREKARFLSEKRSHGAEGFRRKGAGGAVGWRS